MSVYLVGSSLTAAHLGNTLAYPEPNIEHFPLLNQKVALPYFRSLPEKITTPEQLIQLLSNHLHQAIHDARWSNDALSHTPIFLTSTTYNLSIYEHTQPDDSSYSLDNIAALLRQKLNNPNIYSIATACTSAAQAVVQAAQLLNNGIAQQALVVGFECFNDYTPSHFHAMQLLANQLPYRPLQQSHGMILGEAIAALALSTQPVSGCLKLHSFATASDIQSFTNIHFASIHQLIEQMLNQTQLSPTDVAFIKTHATGSNSDADEKQWLQQYFAHAQTLCIKAYTGHTLGASAAVETAWYARTLANHLLPSTRCLHYFAGFGGSVAGWISEAIAV